MAFLKYKCFEKVDLKIISRRQKIMKNFLDGVRCVCGGGGGELKSLRNLPYMAAVQTSDVHIHF